MQGQIWHAVGGIYVHCDRWETWTMLNELLGNCRKRKIRCQPVKDDGRCSQCIRLKKDCQFYAVDQQPPPPLVARAGARPHPKAMLVSAVTSPPVASGHPGDMQTHQSYNGRAMSVSHDIRPSGLRQDAYLDDPKRRFYPSLPLVITHH